MDQSEAQFGGNKLFAHADRISQWQRGILPYPITVELNVTNLCNHACPDCSFSYLVNKDKSSLNPTLAMRVIRELAEHGVRAITFSGGGEPLLYGEDNLLELMQHAVDHGIQVALITNGSLLRDPAFLQLCTWIRVSLDAYDDVTFERFHGRGEGEFLKVVENLRAYSGLSLNMKNEGSSPATLGVGFLTDNGSVARKDIERMTKFCMMFYGLDYLQFRPLVKNMVEDPSLTGGDQGDLLALESQYKQVHTTVEKARVKHPSTMRVLWSGGKYAALQQPNAGRTYNSCLAHFTEAVIAANAKVYICCHTQGQDKYCLGSLQNKNTFHSVWHSERARQVYDRIDPSRHCPPACRLHLQNLVLQQIKNLVHPNFI